MNKDLETILVLSGIAAPKGEYPLELNEEMSIEEMLASAEGLAPEQNQTVLTQLSALRNEVVALRLEVEALRHQPHLTYQAPQREMTWEETIHHGLADELMALRPMGAISWRPPPRRVREVKYAQRTKPVDCIPEDIPLVLGFDGGFDDIASAPDPDDDDMPTCRFADLEYGPGTRVYPRRPLPHHRFKSIAHEILGDI